MQCIVTLAHRVKVKLNLVSNDKPIFSYFFLINVFDFEHFINARHKSSMIVFSSLHATVFSTYGTQGENTIAVEL